MFSSCVPTLEIYEDPGVYPSICPLIYSYLSNMDKKLLLLSLDAFFDNWHLHRLSMFPTWYHHATNATKTWQTSLSPQCACVYRIICVNVSHLFTISVTPKTYSLPQVSHTQNLITTKTHSTTLPIHTHSPLCSSKSTPFIYKSHAFGYKMSDLSKDPPTILADQHASEVLRLFRAKHEAFYKNGVESAARHLVSQTGTCVPQRRV